MDNFSMGSGSALLGGSSPIQEAMARRGGGVGATAQKSPAAMGFDPNAVPTPAPQGQPMGMPQGGGEMAAMPGMPSQSTEAQTIIDALSKRLDNDSKMKRTQVERGF